MAEPSSNLEIEDVLSSIRRLVSRDTPPAAQPAAARPQLLFGGIAPPEAPSSEVQSHPSEEERLVLTPALRVTDEAEPDEAVEAWAGESRWLRPAEDELAFGGPQDEAPEESLSLADAFIEEDDAVWAVRENDPAPFSEAEELQEETTAEVLSFDNVTTQSAFDPAEPAEEAWSTSVDEAASAEEAHIVPEPEMLPEAPAAEAVAEADSPTEDAAVADVVTLSVAEPFTLLRSGRRRLHLAECPMPQPAEEAVTPPSEADEGAEAALSTAEAVEEWSVPPAADPADAEAPVAEEQAAFAAMAAEDTDSLMEQPVNDETDEPEVASARTDEPAPAAPVLDEAAMSRLVTDVLRQELQGQLGERITRNMRLLVRREIERALATRDIE